MPWRLGVGEGELLLAGNGRGPAVCVVSSHMGTWVLLCMMLYDAVHLSGCVRAVKHVQSVQSIQSILITV